MLNNRYTIPAYLFKWVITPVIVLCTSILLIASGCQILYDWWPVKLPPDLATYTETGPNKGWTNIGGLQKLKDKAVTKHVIEQLDLKSKMDNDKALYERAIEQANINIQQAIAERSAMIGTLESPGWLLGLGLGITGFGSYIYGFGKQRPLDYTKTEVQESVKKLIQLDRDSKQSMSIDELVKTIT
jgi:hypothetical protein